MAVKWSARRRWIKLQNEYMDNKHSVNVSLSNNQQLLFFVSIYSSYIELPIDLANSFQLSHSQGVPKRWNATRTGSDSRQNGNDVAKTLT